MEINFLTVPSKRLRSFVKPDDTSFVINNTEGWDDEQMQPEDFGDTNYGVFRTDANDRLEIFEYTAENIADGEVTIVKRGLSFAGGLDNEIQENKKEWIKGETIVELGSNPPQLFTWLKNYIDTGLNEGAATADEATKGIGEVATVDEIESGANDGSGDSDGSLLVTAQRLANSIYKKMLPKKSEKDAMDGTRGTPSTDNTFVTDDDTTGNGRVLRDSKVPYSGIENNINERYSNDDNDRSFTASDDSFIFGWVEIDQIQSGESGSFSLLINDTRVVRVYADEQSENYISNFCVPAKDGDDIEIDISDFRSRVRYTLFERDLNSV